MDAMENALDNGAQVLPRPGAAVPRDQLKQER